MKQRILTGLIGACIVIPCVIFMHYLPFPILIALISAVGVYEIIHAVGCRNKAIYVISIITAAVIPFLFHYHLTDKIPLLPAAVIYTLAYLIIMVLGYSKTTFADAVISLFSTFAVPVSMSMLISLRDVYISYPEKFDKYAGIFLILYSFFAAWGTDIFAYFVGRKLGKHKLCPEISPKKSVEGAIGGILGAIVVSEILFIVFDRFFFTFHTLTWYHILAVTVILSVISMFGDLSASVIKRNHGVKDFGKLLPGHGGVMDRFDSMLFVLPSLYLAVWIIEQI
jgi:phosphatidate cytidylyltransferase